MTMAELELKVEALTRCIPENVFQRALAEVSVSAPPVEDLAMEMQVSALLLELGIPQHIKGYRYLVMAIMLAVDNPKLMGRVTKELLPAVAEAHDTTWYRVERAIRHAIEVGWTRSDYETQVRYFGNSVAFDRAKPTLSEFIARMANEVRQRAR